MRPSKRKVQELRNITIVRNYTKHAEGSVLIEFGDTKLICNATVESGVPRFLRDSGQGWVTAEYGMLPRSTGTRMAREASKGKQGGRTMEIQRLIGRSLRAAVDLSAMGENTVFVDCDVIQADGGTRTAAITGACVALYDALQVLRLRDKLPKNPFSQFVAAVSVGVYNGTPILDLDYAEDCSAQTDMNVVVNELGNFIEVQGTAEHGTFSHDQLMKMLDLAKQGAQELIKRQKAAID